MDNPRYIVLVALDTPSRQTGMYISGGVMAAPTVGAVMADILPYLGVEKTGEAAQTVTVEDYTGLSAKDAEALLKAAGLSARCSGEAETVTQQIPAPGIQIPYGSQVMLYLGEEPTQRQVTVPDFMGLTRQQASDLAGSMGLYIQIKGNPGLETTVVVTSQSVQKDTQVPAGTTVTLEFTDLQVRD